MARVAVIATALVLVLAAPAEASRWRVVRPYNAKLNRIAMCESTMRWHLNSGNGFYGGLQFTVGTWRSVGGRGMPHWASVLEQKYRAVKVYLRRGSWADWPVCGYR
jgi:transglycosylase-like protein